MSARAGYGHLHPSALPLLALGNDERIRALRVDRWIDYPRALHVLERLKRLLDTPRRERMPCLLLHGPSNIGKTLIIAKFLREHPSAYDPLRGIEVRPVISMQMPPAPDQRRFLPSAAGCAGRSPGPNAALANLEYVARDILKRMAPQMLIVDEVHHLLAGSAREQRAALNLLKYLANEVKMSVVAVGTSDAPVAFQSDPQIHSRFTAVELPRWSESEELRRLLAAFESVLPLKNPSQLSQRGIVQFMVAASGGLLGEVSRLLCDSAEVAIANGTETITLGLLEEVARVRR